MAWVLKVKDKRINYYIIKSRDSHEGYATEVEIAYRILTCEAELLLYKLYDKRDPKSAPGKT